MGAVPFLLVLVAASPGDATNPSHPAATEASDSVIIAAAKQYPGVKFHYGQRDQFLVDLSQAYAEAMAKINSQSWRGEGHFGWELRLQRIRRTLRMSASEVTAETWRWQANSSGAEIGKELFWCWRRSPGHWRVVSRPHKKYGDGLAKSKQGIWYGCVIVAD